MPALKKLNPIPKFVFKFLFWMLLLALIIGYLKTAFPQVISGYVTFTASVAKLLLNLFGLQATQDQNMLNLGNFSVQVVLECAAAYQILVFCAAVIAFPAKAKPKLLGILLAVPLFYFIDLLRISTLLIVGNYGPEFFDFVHLYTGQIFVIFIVILAWLAWIKKFAHGGKTA